MSIEEMQEDLYISNNNRGKVQMVDRIIDDFVFDDKEVFSRSEILRILRYHKDYSFKHLIDGIDTRKEK